MSEKKNLSDEELKNISGGTGIQNAVNFSGASAKNAVSYSGGDFSASGAKTMVETTASVKSKGIFGKLLLMFKKRSAKNVTAGSSSVVKTDGKNFYA